MMIYVFSKMLEFLSIALHFFSLLSPELPFMFLFLSTVPSRQSRLVSSTHLRIFPASNLSKIQSHFYILGIWYSSPLLSTKSINLHTHPDKRPLENTVRREVSTSQEGKEFLRENKPRSSQSWIFSLHNLKN